jgi:AcrR family transcriptional regulator
MTEPMSSYRRPRGRPSKTPDQTEEMRQLIAKTAERLFQKEGYANVSIRRLASEVGCSPMTLYKYYDSKLAILQTLWAVVFREVFGEIRESLVSVTDPNERLRIICTLYVGYWLANPEHYRLVFMADGVTQSDVSLFVDNPEIVADFELFSRAIAETDGDIAQSAIKLHTDLVLAALHGIAHNQITISANPWSDANETINLLLERLFQCSVKVR